MIAISGIRNTMSDRTSTQILLSLPAASAAAFDGAHGGVGADWFVACDPPGVQLGSGGGTVYLLLEAWRASAHPGTSFGEWLARSRKLIIHGGGRGRRLPAYAPCGKPLIPIPVMRRSFGQRLDQRLIDFQLESYERLLAAAPDSSRILVTSGDVLLRFDDPPSSLPAADVVAFGMGVSAEVAQDFGVFIRGIDAEVDCFLQKPSAVEIADRSGATGFLVDTGAWLMSEAAVRVLIERCGLSADDLAESRALPGSYELYSQFGLALGARPVCPDRLVGGLSSAVIELRSPRFYHLGTNRQLIESVASLQNDSGVAESAPLAGGLSHPPIFVLNSVFDPPARRAFNTHVWVENSHVGDKWRLASSNVITGVPKNDWALQLDAGSCLDVVPVAGGSCIRGYGFDDSFSGPVGAAETSWYGRPAVEWFERRGLTPDGSGLAADVDINEAALFPVVEDIADHGDFVQWLIARRPEHRPDFAALWLAAVRKSAFELNREADLAALRRRRDEFLAEALPAMQAKASDSVFYRLDLDSTADLLLNRLNLADAGAPDPDPVRIFGDKRDDPPGDPLTASTDAMFRAEIARRIAARSPRDRARLVAVAQRCEADAFRFLRASIVAAPDLVADPRRSVLEDQIVWARSPVRLDLGGGWTDTPPYCLHHGGRVVNVAVDLNGQPPIQVFARVGKRCELVIRSIDLGVAETVRTYDELDTFGRPGSEFALAKAALALTGFLPRFQESPRWDNMADQLRDRFGGGIELSMVAAIPAGSGLGTSSILAATLLGALGDLCGLNWDERAIVRRVLVTEQMLTTGGGWQDQVGGIYRGIKLAETPPGLLQDPAVRWLPDHLFSSRYANVRMLLYYTGVTRLAKNILQEIVRGMFLNSSRILSCLESIRNNATLAHDAVQRGDFEMLAEAVASSWRANKELDGGTNPDEIDRILESIRDRAISAKLLGAGGGGYLLIFAKDAVSAQMIRSTLNDNPPNPRARFVDFSLSNLGLQVTRS
jgi:galactokinase/mevalonate kinase-like predicted kinase